MNETIRTIVFVAAGVVAALAAFATRPAGIDSPRNRGAGPEPLEGKPLFPDYTDPLLARSLEIKQFDVKKEIPRGTKPVVIEFTATEAGEFPILCSEYCGDGHENMKGQLVVLTR